MKSIPSSGCIPVHVKGLYDFICQTPYGDGALLISGLASKHFYPALASPLLITPTTTFLLRISATIIDSLAPLLLRDLKRKIHSVHNDISWIQYLALLVSLASILVFYHVSLITSIVLGIYRGLVVISTPPEKKPRRDATGHDGTNDHVTIAILQ